MTVVFVSGCYDLLHAGHVQFLENAKRLGDRLVVCLPSDRVVLAHRLRQPSLPLDQKVYLFQSLAVVDDVVVGDDEELGLNFRGEFMRLRPDILAVGTDDQYTEAKRALCAETGARYVQVPKSRDWPDYSTTALVRRIRSPVEVPVRVDFAGGWLDVPRFARDEGFIVNCTITPFTRLHESPYMQSSGVGGSAAWALLEGGDGVADELARGVGWQDPAVIAETGLCVWRSGPRPVLEEKLNPHGMLARRLALLWTGTPHDTPGVANQRRNYELIHRAGRLAAEAVRRRDFASLCRAVQVSYEAQLEEGMEKLFMGNAVTRKYCGGGWGGYAVYLFAGGEERDQFVESTPNAMDVEPFMRFGAAS